MIFCILRAKKKYYYPCSRTRKVCLTWVSISCSCRSISLLAEPSALCSSIREKCSMLLMDNFSCRVKITSFIIKKPSVVIDMIVQSHMNDQSGTQKQFITNRFSRTLLWLATLSLIFSQHNFNSVIFPKAKGKRDALQYVAHLWTAFNIYTEQDLRLRKSILEWSRLLPGTYLNRCVAVKFKWFSLPILQVHFQNIWHKKQRVVLYRFLRMKKKTPDQ